MKIAFIGPAFPLRGGIAEFMMHLSTKLQKEIMISNLLLKQYPRLLFPGKISSTNQNIKSITPQKNFCPLQSIYMEKRH